MHSGDRKKWGSRERRRRKKKGEERACSLLNRAARNLGDEGDGLVFGVFIDFEDIFTSTYLEVIFSPRFFVCRIYTKLGGGMRPLRFFFHISTIRK